jgi:PKD repeat protein
MQTARYAVLFIGLACLASIPTGCSGGCGRDGRTASTTAGFSAEPTARSSQRSQKVVQPLEAHTVAATETGGAAYDPISVSTKADPDTGSAPLTVSFVATVSGGPPGLQFRWDFGDNSQPSHQLKVHHTYQDTGQYTATFTATGPDVDASREQRIEVAEGHFDLDVEADPDIGQAPLTVRFSAVVDPHMPSTVTYEWDFGDGGRDGNSPTTHTYMAAGTYTARLTVTTPQGQQITRDIEIQVDPRDAEMDAQ